MSNNQLPPSLPPQVNPSGMNQRFNAGMQPPKKKMGAGKIILIVFACLIGLGLIANMCDESKSITSLSNVNDDSIKTVAREKLEKENVKTWEESSEKDEMTDAMTYWSTIRSDNSEQFEFPYHGGAYLDLWVRKSPKYGTDVYIKITTGQLLCSKYDGTNHVTVRFDDAPAKRYGTIEPADMSPDQLFLSNAKDFIAKAKKARTIKIEVPVYQEGNRVFIFKLDEPLKWEH